MEVTFFNTFVMKENANSFIVGVLTMAVLISLELAVTKVVFKSKERNTEMVWRREIFSRLSGFRSVTELLSGLDFRETDLFDKKDGQKKNGIVSRVAVSGLDFTETDLFEKKNGIVSRVWTPVMNLFSVTKNADESDAKDGQAENDGTSGDDTNACMLNPRKVHLRRLIIPLICRVLLLFVEITVIALSGQTLAADGNGHHNAYWMVETNSPPTLTRGCTSELLEVRGEQATGLLQTCTSSVRVDTSASERDIARITVSRNYLTNQLRFRVVTNEEGSNGNRVLFVTSTYQSHDGAAQTLLPFDDVLEGSSGPGDGIDGIEEKATLRLDILNDIYDKLVKRLEVVEVGEADQTFKFGEGRISGIGVGDNSYEAGFLWQGDQEAVLDALNTTILQDFKLEPQPGRPLISFDERRGLYGPEQGEGSKELKFNTVPNWVWVFLIFVLATVAMIFDRINSHDPEFFLFRAFVEVNSMDCVAGPLALENKEFRFANFQSFEGEVSENDVGHIGFHPADPTQVEVTTFKGVRDVQGTGMSK
jgi:hypothetical protein